jgi:hypothetical protein
MSEEQRLKQVDEYSRKDDAVVFEIWGLDHASSWKKDYHEHECNDQDGSDISFTKKSFECLCRDLTERGRLMERDRLVKSFDDLVSHHTVLFVDGVVHGDLSDEVIIAPEWVKKRLQL